MKQYYIHETMLHEQCYIYETMLHTWSNVTYMNNVTYMKLSSCACAMLQLWLGNRNFLGNGLEMEVILMGFICCVIVTRYMLPGYLEEWIMYNSMMDLVRSYNVVEII